MPTIVSNPLFQVILLFIVTTGIWFVATDEISIIKKNIVSIVSDFLYYFILTSFGLNLLFNFREIINEPYRVLLVSSNIYWIALLVVIICLAIRVRRVVNFSYKFYEQLLNQSLNYLFLLGLFNHLFYYYKYRSINSVVFTIVYFLLYLFKDTMKYDSKNELALIGLALLHGLVMYSFSKIIIYYQVVFYPYQIVSLLITSSALLYYLRRDFSSRQK